MRLFIFHKNGYTLTELIIAITISGLIIIGISIFIERIQENILISSARTNAQIAVGEFSSRVREIRAMYPQLISINGEVWGQDALILTNSGISEGYIVTPVKLEGEKYTYESSGSTLLHQERLIALKPLSGLQIQSITNSGSSLTSLIEASKPEVIMWLDIADFKVTLYNSGALADILITTLVRPLPELTGRAKSEIPKGEWLNLVFNF